MYNYYNKQSHDAYEKGKTAVNRADIVVAAPSALEALGCEGYDRFDGNVSHQKLRRRKQRKSHSETKSSENLLTMRHCYGIITEQ